MRVWTLASWGGILALTACSSNHSSPPAAEAGHPLEDEAIQVKNQAKPKTTISPSVALPEIQTSQSLRGTTRAGSPQLTSSRSSRASVPNRQTSELLRARLERIRTQQARVRSLPAPSPVANNKIEAKIESVGISPPDQSLTTATPTSAVQPSVLGNRSQPNLNSPSATPRPSSSSLTNPPVQPQVQQRDDVSPSALPGSTNISPSSFAISQGEANELHQPSPRDSPQVTATALAPAANPHQHLSHTTYLSLNPRPSLATANSAIDPAAESPVNRHHLSGQEPELTGSTAERFLTSRTSDNAFQEETQPDLLSPFQTSNSPPTTPADSESIPSNEGISQTIARAESDGVTPAAIVGQNPQNLPFTGFQENSHRQSGLSTQVHITPSPASQQPQFSGPAKTGPHLQTGIAPGVRLSPTSSAPAQEEAQTTGAEAQPSNPVTATTSDATSGPPPQITVVDLSPSLTSPEESPQSLGNQSSLLETSPSGATDLETAGFSGTVRIDLEDLELFPVESSLITDSLGTALGQTEQPGKTVALDLCVPDGTHWGWLAQQQDNDNSASQTVDNNTPNPTSLPLGNGVKQRHNQPESFNQAKTCPQGTKPLAYIMPEAAAAGTSIPGKVETP